MAQAVQSRGGLQSQTGSFYTATRFEAQQRNSGRSTLETSDVGALQRTSKFSASACLADNVTQSFTAIVSAEDADSANEGSIIMDYHAIRGDCTVVLAMSLGLTCKPWHFLAK
jgi:hypothetical protein